jgi:hypothetical protein
MPATMRFSIKEGAYTAASARNREGRAVRRGSIFVDQLLNDELVFNPIPFGGAGIARLGNPREVVEIDVSPATERSMKRALAVGALTTEVVDSVLAEARLSQSLKKFKISAPLIRHSEDALKVEAALAELGLCAVRVARNVHEGLLRVRSPFKEFHCRLTDRAKLALAFGWEAIARTGKYPLPPYGLKRLQGIDQEPAGAFHFVSASDADAGYNYTMGIALSPEAQALKTMNVSFGLDGELIVPGQAVSPIPPLLSLATRLFASGIMTSSNISEEQQSIPIRSFPQPDNYTDLQPVRPGLNPYQRAVANTKIAIPAILNQLKRNNGRYEVDAVIDISGVPKDEALTFARKVMESAEIRKAHEESVARLPAEKQKSMQERIALFLNVARTTDEASRKATVLGAIDLAAQLGLKYLAVTDDVEDSWLPGIHEYFDAELMNELMQHADRKGILVIDGRPVDPMYTASTALQRIQSVMTTLAVDILKAGMWLTLDARSAEEVWLQLQSNPAISRGMCLMPIGIVEPWSAFVDNRDPAKNPRAILDPFEKIKFMIEEAKRLNMPSLLTDTRHKHQWVLLGGKANDFPKHPRESGDVTSLLSWAEFMGCERLARDANLLLGQAGSIEVSQIFQIITETTFDAAKTGRNPATAFWTAETERVLRSEHYQPPEEDLQSQRSASVDAYLAVVNRIYESHAKIDGWLRFLITRRPQDAPETVHFEKVREKLSSQKQAAEKAQDELLQLLGKRNNRQDEQKVVEVWGNCRTLYTSYHAGVKAQFDRIRTLVAEEWTTMKRQEPRARKSAGA